MKGKPNGPQLRPAPAPKSGEQKQDRELLELEAEMQAEVDNKNHYSTTQVDRAASSSRHRKRLKKGHN